MKNLVRKITIEEYFEEDEVTSPCQIEGYYNLTPEEQVVLEELPSQWWKMAIDDFLFARQMDKALGY